MRKIAGALLLAVSITAVSSCGTPAYLREMYSGNRGLNKSEATQTVVVPTSIGMCVAPNGAIPCRERPGASFGELCGGQCRPSIEFVMQDGPPQQMTGVMRTLVLEAADGKRVNLNATPDQYNLYKRRRRGPASKGS
ncbi:MAG: hypothetical protein ROO76_09040 [Terriglobia bacterium]|nr:hypothetical protein [Terriglobia bacterium]